MDKALLVLADGSVFEGRSVGAPGFADGELVFNTSMTGYQEMLTDPSYAGQLLVLTYPMIGNYGVDAMVEESAKIQPTGLVVREMASFHSHLRSEGDLSRFLKTRGVVAIDQVDTRAVTRRIRNHGVMPATITTTETAGAASERLKSFPDYDRVNWAATVTTASPYAWPGGGSRFRIALLDGGVKRNIMRSLTARGCSVDVFPLDTRAEDILAITPRWNSPLARTGKPRRPAKRRARGLSSHRKGAYLRDLSRAPDCGERGGGEVLQAPLRPPRGKPPREGSGDGRSDGYRSESRVRG